MIKLIKLKIGLLQLLECFDEILKDKRGEYEIPHNVVEAIARVMLPDIMTFFESEEGRKKYEAWKAKNNSPGKKPERCESNN